MKKKLDKRTKEYKEWKKQQPAEGLGDVVEKITEATGIKSAVNWLAGADCGCDERKEKMNKLRFRKQPLCLNESEYSFLSSFFSNYDGRVDQSANYELAKIYARIFEKRGVQPTSCSSCIKQRVKDLREVFDTYE